MDPFVFGSPAFLYALPLAPAALLLALLARRRRRVTVPSLRAWEAVAALPIARPRPFDIRPWIAFLSMLLVVFSLADTEIRWRRGAVRAAVLVDTSASMASRREGRPPRSQQAADALRARGREAADLRLELYTTARPEALGHDLSATEAARRLAEAPHDPPETDAAVALGAILAATEADALPVLWISDRLPPLPDARVHPLLVGDAGRNAGLVAARLETGETDTPQRLFLSLVRTGDAPRTVNLTATQADATERDAPPCAARTLRLDRTGPVPLTLSLGESYDPRAPLRVRLEVQGEDDLAADNRITLPPWRGWTAAVDAEKFSRLALALRTSGRCDLLLAEHIAEADFAVVSRSPKSLPRTGIWLVEPEEAACGLAALGQRREAYGASIRDDAALPPMTTEEVGPFELPELFLPPDARVLATALTDEGERPWIAAWRWREREVVCLASLPASWTATPGFAVAVAALRERLSPPAAALPGLAESDNRLPAAPPPPRMADLAGPVTAAYGLSRLFSFLAAALILLFLVPWTRLRGKRRAFDHKGASGKHGAFDHKDASG